MSTDIKTISPLNSVSTSTLFLIDNQEMTRTIRWHISWCQNYWNQGGTGLIFASLEIVPITLLLIPVVNVITYVALSMLSPRPTEDMLHSCMDEGNATGAYILTEWGQETEWGQKPTVKNQNGESLLDLFASKGEKEEGFSKQDLAICQTLLENGGEADFSKPGFKLLLESAIKEESLELVLPLMKQGVEAPETFPQPLEESSNELLKKYEPFHFQNKSLKDLTVEALQETIPLLPSSSKSLDHLVRIYGQRKKNCPLILGESEGEREALVKAFACEIANDDVPTPLKNKRLIGWDIGNLNSSTIIEMKKLLVQYPQLIYYIHNFDIFSNSDTTRNSGSSFWSNSNDYDDMKKLLVDLASTGRVIFSMKPSIYNKHFEADYQVQESFSTIETQKLTDDESLLILSNAKEGIESDHGVLISDQALRAAIFLSRYVPGSSLPKTPLELLDGASALLNQQKECGSFALQDAKRKRDDHKFQIEFYQLKAGAKNQKMVEKHREELKKVEEEIVRLEEQDKEEFSIQKKYLHQKAKRAYLQTFPDELMESVAPLVEELDKELLTLKSQIEKGHVKFEVDRESVARVVSEKAKMPLHRIQGDEAKQLLHLEESLAQEVMGQDHAVKETADIIKRARSGFRDESKPQGVLLYAGPTGVGKTELAKALAIHAFGHKRNMIRLDMSEYGEKHNKSRLIGAPPGYVGYDYGGQLTEALKKNPYCVVLLDEIEKAHPEVLTLLLQVFDDGRITDGKGETIDCSQAVFIMTTNLGSRELVYNQSRCGWNQKHPDEIILTAMNKSAHFPPELQNRLDAIIPFYSLENLSIIEKIAEKKLKEVQKQAEERHEIAFNWTDRAVAQLAKEGLDKQFGARPLNRLIDRTVMTKLSEMVIQETLKEGDLATLDYNGKAYTIKVETTE